MLPIGLHLNYQVKWSQDVVVKGYELIRSIGWGLHPNPIRVSLLLSLLLKSIKHIVRFVPKKRMEVKQV